MRGVTLPVPPFPPCPVVVDWVPVPPSLDVPPADVEPPVFVFVVVAAALVSPLLVPPDPLVAVPLLLVEVAVGVPPLVVVAVVLTPPVVLAAVPLVVAPMLVLALTGPSAPESSLQPQEKHRATKAGRERGLSM